MLPIVYVPPCYLRGPKKGILGLKLARAYKENRRRKKKTHDSLRTNI